jgi:hypothetical protein
MIYRTAEVYLSGRKGAAYILAGKEPTDVWHALSSNVGSLVAFFDALILSKHLPIIDYGGTFDPRLGYDSYGLYQRCNNAAGEQVLVAMHVQDYAYHQAKNAALDALRTWPELPAELSASILQEMSAFDYSWQPDLSDLGPLPEDERQVALLRFLFGGLLFGAYAQTTGAAHLLQPKRSRLYLAASLGAMSAAYQYEQELFDELNAIVNQTEGMQEGHIKLNALPNFLPYLLSQDPKSPSELLSKALVLRKDSAVQAYRNWRTQLVRDWRDKGKIALANEKQMQRITRSVLRKLKLSDDLVANPSLNIGWDGVGVDPGLAIPIGRLWGWALSHIPSRRYTKLLMRMHLADHEYRHLDRALQRLWASA